MPSRYSKTQSNSSESGFFLALLAVILFGLLAVIGLAVDSGFLFRTQIVWKNALDAAAVSGARLLMNRGYLGAGLSTSQIVTEVQNRTRNMVAQNLRQMGYDNAIIASATAIGTLAVNVSFGNPSVVRVTGSIRQPTLILGSLPGFQQFSDINASAAAQMNPMRVVLVIDHSGSMTKQLSVNCNNCTQGQPNCQNPCMRRWDSVKLNLKKFLGYLMPGDEVAMVLFNSEATEIPITGTPDAHGHYIVQITATNVLSQTGAPSIIDELKSAVQNLPEPPSQNDPLAFTAIRKGLAKAQRIVADAPFSGRSIVIPLTDGAPNEQSATFDEGDTNSYWPDEINPDHDPHPDEGATLRAACGWDLDENNHQYFTANQKLQMLAVMYADLIRATASIYSIGIGDNDPGTADIFQNHEQQDSPDFESVKSLLMARMSGDLNLLQHPATWPSYLPANALYPYDFQPSGPGNRPCVQSAAALAGMHNGEYGFAQNNGQLEEIFARIASQNIHLIDPNAP